MDFVIFWKLISCCILKTCIAGLHCLYYANVLLECCEAGRFAVGLCMFCKRAHSVAEVLILVLFTVTDSVILLLFKCSQVRFSQSLDHWSLWKLCTCAVMHNFIIVVSFQHALMKVTCSCLYYIYTSTASGLKVGPVRIRYSTLFDLIRALCFQL